MPSDFSPSDRHKRRGAKVYAKLIELFTPAEVSPSWCPSCQRQVRTRASESQALENGVRHRRRACTECGDAWFTAEVSRDALLSLTERLDDAETELADAHSADLQGAVDGIRHALRSLEGPLRKQPTQRTDHAPANARPSKGPKARSPRRATPIAPPGRASDG